MWCDEHEHVTIVRYVSGVSFEASQACEREAGEAAKREHPAEAVVNLSSYVSFLMVNFVRANRVPE